MNDEDFIHELDQLRDLRQTAPAHLAPRILANVSPREPLDRIFAWFGESLWRVAATALLPLAIGFGVGMGNIDERETWSEAETLVFIDTLEEYGYDEI